MQVFGAQLDEGHCSVVMAQLKCFNELRAVSFEAAAPEEITRGTTHLTSVCTKIDTQVCTYSK